MKIPKYSVIKYYEELLEDDIESFYSYLEEGIIIHLFLKGTFQEELTLNEYDTSSFNEAIEDRFLYVYEDETDISDVNVTISVDGDILEKDIYRNICNNKESKFNHSQYDIITAPPNTNIIVTSGAGTGKTTTMINRLLYMKKTQEEFDFEQAVLITFTNKASSEMKEKLILTLEKYYKLTKDPIYLDMMEEATRCSIGTIHKFAKKLINSYGKYIGINKNVQIRSFKHSRQNAITKSINKVFNEEKDLYKIIKNYQLYEVERKLLSIWDKIDNFSVDINSQNYEVSFGEDEINFAELISKILRYAQEILNEEKDNELEVSDLMKKLSNKGLFKNIDTKYKLIMVDEFQDSDNIQIEFVTEFCNSTGCDLLVVGDEKQSIYRFRGAEHTAFNKLKELIKNSPKKLQEFTMTRNYRTDAVLLGDINSIFVNVDRRVKCFSYKEKDHIYSLMNKDRNVNIEYVDISLLDDRKKFYTNILENKTDEETVAVLFRTNNDVKEFKEFCDVNGILCRTDATGGFYRHEAVRDFYVMIKSIIEETDIGTMYSFIHTPYINKIADNNIILKGSDKDRRDYLGEILNNSQWAAVREGTTFKNPLVLIDEIIPKYKPITNYYSRTLVDARIKQKKYKEIAYVKTLEYKLNLEHLLYLIKEQFSENTSSIFQIEEFLKIKIATDNTIDAKKLGDKLENKFIQCLTVHKAKGLEYDYVVLDKLTNKFISFKPVDVILKNTDKGTLVGYKVMLGDDEYKNNYYSLYLNEEKDEIIGEESRLLYVALTRCKKGLYLNMSEGLAATEGANTWKSLVRGVMSYV